MQSQKEAVLNSMIDDELLTQQVKKLGIFVGFKQVENQIKQFDEFKENGKYGSRDNRCQVALWSAEIEFSLGKEKYIFESKPDFSVYPWNLFDF